jgi:hypothetical protein
VERGENTQGFIAMKQTLLFVMMLFPACEGTCVADALAETPTTAMLRALCGPKRVGLATIVDREATRYGLRPAVLVALMRVEGGPGCPMDRVGALGEICTGQIKPGTWAAGKYTPEQLKRPRVCIHCIARHLRRTTDLCGGVVLHGLYVYSGRKKCRDYGTDKKTKKDYARTVLGYAEQAEGEQKS